MAAVTAEQLAAARAVAAAAVRVGRDGRVAIRMPVLGSVRHGTADAALVGCPCLPCDQVRDQLAASMTPPVEAPLVEVLVDGDATLATAAAAGAAAGESTAPAAPAAEVSEVAAAPAPARRVAGRAGPDLTPLELPAGLVPALLEGLDGIACSNARRVALAHLGDDAEAAAEVLLMLGLATDPAAAGVAPRVPAEVA
jgi:hypothetical protein